MTAQPGVTLEGVIVDKQALIEDAKNRFDRTFFQGLAIDVVVAVAVAVYAVATSPDPIVWAAVGASLLRTVAQACASYVMRRFIDAKTGKLLPPAPQPAPAELTTDALVFHTTVEAGLPPAELGPDTPPEPEQPNPLMLLGDEHAVTVYPDQSPQLLDDDDDLPAPKHEPEPSKEGTGEPV